MVQVMYYITKEDEIIFATSNKFNSLEEAMTLLKGMYADLMAKSNIKNITLTDKELTFTDFKEGETDEIHKFIITK